MKCERCGVEVEEGKTLCPQCEAMAEQEQTETVTVDVPVEENAEGEAFSVETVEETAEETSFCDEQVEDVPAPRKGLRLWQLILAFVAGGIVLCGLALLLLKGLDVSFKRPENDIYRKDSYTVSDKELIRKSDNVVATAGEEELTVSLLQAYYWLGFSELLNENAYTYSSYGLDYTQPMDTQLLPNDEKTTWQMFFLENALSAWRVNAQLAMAAREEGYTLPENLQESIDNMPENLAKMATETGYASAEEMLTQELGACCTQEDYIAYLEQMLLAQSFYSAKYSEFTPDAAACEAYFAANEQTLAQSGVTKEAGNIVNVRHILLQPKDVAVDAEGNPTYDEKGYAIYTEEGWEACKAEAEALLQQWLDEGATEESFATLASLYSVDGGSSANGGLYSNVTKGQMVEAFDAWIMDNGRKTGDYGIVQTPYGYHIMYFCAGAPYWQVAVTNTVLQENLDGFLAQINEKWPVEVEYKKLVLGVSAITQPADETVATENVTLPE